MRESVCKPTFKGVDYPDSLFTLRSSIQDEQCKNDTVVKTLVVSNIRITPGTMLFKDAYEGKHYRQRLLIQNIGEKHADVVIGKPTSYTFKINLKKSQYKLAAGLSVVKYIDYTYHTSDNTVKAIILIKINDESVLYPLTVSLAQTTLSVNPPEIDFGMVNVHQGLFKRSVLLENSGHTGGLFLVSVGKTTAMTLSAAPQRGEIAAFSRQYIDVWVSNVEEGTHVTEVWIKCKVPIRVILRVTAIVPHLTILNASLPRVAGITLVDFHRTYYGVRQMKSFVFRNESNVTCIFLAMVSIKGKLYAFKEAVLIDKFCRQFSITPHVGLVRPFEGRVFTIEFHPRKFELNKGWRSTDNYIDDFLTFFHLINVKHLMTYTGGSGTKMKRQESSPYRRSLPPVTQSPSTGKFSIDSGRLTLPNNPDISEIISEIDLDGEKIDPDDSTSALKEVQLFIYGTAQSVDVKIVPSELDLGTIAVDTTVTRVISLTNMSDKLPVELNCMRTINVNIEPAYLHLKARQGIEVLVTINPTFAGSSNRTAVFNAFFRNQIPEKLEDEIVIIETFTVPIKVNVTATKFIPAPKFNMGIVPQITHEVGYLTQDVCFMDNVPKPHAAMLGKECCPSHGTKEEGCRIAFPNDLSRSLRNTDDPDIVRRTIFTGKVRYRSDPDTDYTLTSAQREQKNAHHSYYELYCRKHAAPAKAAPRKVVSVKNYTETLPEEDLYDKEKIITLYTNKMLSEIDPNESNFMPLMPLQLYKITVQPRAICFGKVASNSKCVTTFQIENSNNFPIIVNMHTERYQLKFPDGLRYVISERSTVSVTVVYDVAYGTTTDHEASLLGRFDAVIEYIVNNTHTFQLTVTADVVRRILQLNKNKFVFGTVPAERSDDTVYCNNISGLELFSWKSLPVEIINRLYSAIKFKWAIPYDSCYKIKPENGYVLGRQRLLCHIYYEPKAIARNNVEIKLVPESHVCQIITPVVNLKKPHVYFYPSALNVESIPLNIKTTSVAYLVNDSYEDYRFRVIDANPMKGVNIVPQKGVLKARCILMVKLIFKITAPLVFKFEVVVELEDKYTSIIEVTGDVECPNITVRPKFVYLRRISANSFDRSTIVFKNCGHSKVHIHFPMENYPEYKISSSYDDKYRTFDEEGFMIDPGVERKVFLHFTPTDVASYEFYLPFVMNNMIGPAEKRLPLTMDFQYYMKNSDKYPNDSYTRCINTPNKIPLTTIECTVASHILQVSNFDLEFTYWPNSNWKSVTEHEIFFRNNNLKPTNFFVRMENIQKSPFSVQFTDGKKFTKTKISLESSLGYEEYFVIKVIFKPVRRGKYKVVLPIYLSNNPESVYNYITLKGNFFESSISSNKTTIYFPPVSLNVPLTQTFTLQAHYFLTDALIEANFHAPCFEITYPEGNKVRGGDICVNIPVSVTFRSESSISIECKVVFSNMDEVECVVTFIAIADNCLLTTHAFVMNVYNCEVQRQSCKSEHITVEMLDSIKFLHAEESTMTMSKDLLSSKFQKYTGNAFFPAFPSTRDNNVKNYFNEIVETVEQWVYERGMRCTRRASIPDGFLMMTVDFNLIENNSRKQSPPVYPTMLSFVQYWAGADIVNYFPKKPPKFKKESERINYTYKQYKALIEILEVQGACLAHVHPESLLSYEDYLLYTSKVAAANRKKCEDDGSRGYGNDNIRVMPVIESASGHDSRMKRAWLDVLLQIAKTLKLARVTLESYHRHCELLGIQQPRGVITSTHTYSLPECILMSWMNELYELQRRKLFINAATHKPAPPRKIKTFDIDMSDGLVLIALTATYCPYLVKDCFSDIHAMPNCVEENYHNAGRVVEAWRIIRLGFSVTPEKIVKPNSVFMLFLLTYLYGALQSLIPQPTIYLKTALTTSVTKTISITSRKDTAVYLVELYKNEGNYFSIDEQMIKVNKKSETQVNIMFQAKHLSRVNTILFLHGDVRAGVYSESLVFPLEGEPNPLDPVAEVLVKNNLYANFTHDVQVPVPYDSPAMYDIWMTDEQPGHVDIYKSWQWSEIRKLKIPRLIYINENQLMATTAIKKSPNQDSGVSLSLFVSMLVTRKKTIWLIFKNKIIGDFILKINIVPKKIYDISSEVHIKVPHNWYLDNNCKCDITSTKEEGRKLYYKNVHLLKNLEALKPCPQIVDVRLPAVNKALWKCFSNAYFKTIDDQEEHEFWKKNLFTNVGLHLAEWFSLQAVDMSSLSMSWLFTRRGVYYVDITTDGTTPSTDALAVRDFVTVQNVQDHDGACHVPVHLARADLDVQIMLTSIDDYREVRNYKVFFHGGGDPSGETMKSLVYSEYSDLEKSLSNNGTYEIYEELEDEKK